MKMDLEVVGWRCMDWVALAQDRVKWQKLLNAVTKFRVP